MMNVTILEVAKAAGVSKSAASDILGGQPKYSYRDETVNRVRQAALEIGYQAHSAARLMRQRKKTLIGLCVRIDQRSTLNARVEAMHTELIARGYQPVLMEPSQFAATGGPAIFPSMDLLAGIVSADLSMEETVPGFYNILQRKVPLVALYPVRNSEVDVVTTDGTQIVDIAVDHLVKLGHRRIAFAAWFASENPSDKMKIAGWRQAGKKYDLDLNPAYSIDHSGLAVRPRTASRSVYEEAKSLVATLSSLRPRPTALICPSEMLTLSLLGRLSEAGWSVPADLSVIGYGSGRFGDITAPPLTTVLQPTKEIARAAADLLLERITSRIEQITSRTEENPTAGRRQFIAPTLLVRKSTTHPSS